MATMIRTLRTFSFSFTEGLDCSADRCQVQAYCRILGSLRRRERCDDSRSIAALARDRFEALRGEAVADPKVCVHIAPAGRDPLELVAQLADEDVDRAITADHRVTPDALVDHLALEHAAIGR